MDDNHPSRREVLIGMAAVPLAESALQAQADTSFGSDWERPNDVLMTATHATHDALEKAGIKSVVYESQGAAHEWLTWRRDLNEFAPKLF